MTEMDYRLNLPDPTALTGGDMTSRELGDLFEQVEDLGRKKNAKHDLFADIINDWHRDDVYVFFRQFTEERFAHPERAIGVGNRTVEAAVEQAFPEVDDTRELRDTYNGSLSRGLREEGIGTEGEDVPVIEMFEQQLDIEEASADSVITSLIAEMFEGVKQPWVWSVMVGDDISFYAGDSVVVNGVKKVADDYTGDEIGKAWGVNNDGPTVFYDWAHPDREVQVECQPHCMIGEMKATKADAEKAAHIEDCDEDWIAQTKYDGARLFIHHAGDGDYRAYMAGNKDVTMQLPELFDEPIADQLPEFPFILDSEATPYDTETGEVLPFQHILKRTGRSTDEMLEAGAGGIEVRFKLFDVLNWRGNDISRHPYDERLEILRSAFTPDLVARTGTDFQTVFNASLDSGHEGVVLKKMDAPFEFIVRSRKWYKWKADPMEADLRISEVHEGEGRAAEKVGALTLQAKHDSAWVDVGSVGTGFTDHDRERLWKQHQAGELVGKTVQVDFEELQVTESGTEVALRFPSFTALRPDGEPDSVERLVRIADVEDEVKL